MNFDPDIYTITIRKEMVDGDVYYVGRVAEFINVTVYEESYGAALAIIRNSLCEIATQAAEAGRPLPSPIAECCSEPSGRLTLRISRALHARLNAQVLADDISRLNAQVLADDSCCGVPEKLCSTAQQDMMPTGWSINRRNSLPFHRIEIKAPNGYVAVVDSMDTNPANVLYMLADALLNTGE